MFTTQIDTARKLAIHQVDGGTLQLLDVFIAANDLFRNPRFDADFSVIWDLRDCQVGITLQEIMDLHPSIVSASNAARVTGKTAWVTDSSFAEAVIKLLYAHHDWATEWQTFATLQRAVNWCTWRVVDSGN